VHVVAAPRKNDFVSSLSALGLVSQLGLTVVVPIVAGVVGGVYLDRFLGTNGLILVFMILFGICAGIYGVYHLLRNDIKWKP
jgi:F0F1-type ATP synthase assembly protein I